MTQEEAFLAQARSDYEVFQELLGMDVPECHALHYFRMATEKLGKALLARSGGPVPMSHLTFRHVCLALRGQHGLLRAIGYRDPAKADHFLRHALPVFKQIEDLQPTDTQHCNVEYPWTHTAASGAQEWVAPADWTFPAFQTIRQTSGFGASLMNLVRNLLSHWDKMP